MENNISEADLVALKQKFYDEGHTITDWAYAHGFDRQAVYGVLNGKIEALIGEGQQVTK